MALLFLRTFLAVIVNIGNHAGLNSWPRAAVFILSASLVPDSPFYWMLKRVRRRFRLTHPHLSGSYVP